MDDSKKHDIYSTRSIFLGPPENIGKQSTEFKTSCKGYNSDVDVRKKIVSNLSGNPDKTGNVIFQDLYIGKPPKVEKVYKPCEKLLRKLKREQGRCVEKTSFTQAHNDIINLFTNNSE